MMLLLPMLFFGSVRGVERRCDPLPGETSLQCPGEGQTLAIHSATYRASGEHHNGTTTYCREDVRHIVNKRCSGLPGCKFRLEEEHERKQCTDYNQTANLDLSWTCIPESWMSRFCNAQLETWSLREGYVASPGYPRFYPLLSDCTWSITASAGQSVRLTILDLNLVGQSKCTRDSDILTVTQHGGQLLLEGCGLDNGDWEGAGSQVVESDGPKVTVTFITHRIAPKRGFLLHYQVQGCPTLAAPNGGYLVSRNSSAALYLCCRGHSFNDTGQNALMLRCVDGHWDTTFLPSCLPSSNSSEVDSLPSRTQDGVISRIPDRDFMADVVVPTILMASLLLGNAVVLAVILRIRRQRKDPS